jgi:hypothetical protein
LGRLTDSENKVTVNGIPPVGVSPCAIRITLEQIKMKEVSRFFIYAN